MVAPSSRLTSEASLGAAGASGVAELVEDVAPSSTALEEMVASEDPARRAEAARCPTLDFDLLHRLLSDESPAVRIALLTRQDLTEQELHPLAFNSRLQSLVPEALEPLLSHPRREVRRMLALHARELPLPMWSRIAADADAVRVAMAENEHLPDFAMYWLADSACATTRAAIARRDDLPEGIRQHLAEDPDPLVRDAIEMNPAIARTPPATRPRRLTHACLLKFLGFLPFSNSLMNSTPAQTVLPRSARVRRHMAGFTSAEIMIVAAVIALLAGLGTTYFLRARQSQEDREALTAITAIYAAKQAYLELHPDTDPNSVPSEAQIAPLLAVAGKGAITPRGGSGGGDGSATKIEIGAGGSDKAAGSYPILDGLLPSRYRVVNIGAFNTNPVLNPAPPDPIAAPPLVATIIGQPITGQPISGTPIEEPGEQPGGGDEPVVGIELPIGPIKPKDPPPKGE